MPNMINNPAIQVANLLKTNNPQQMAMEMLRQQNPQVFGQINQMMKIGMTPQQAMQNLGIDQNAIANVRNQFMNGNMSFK